jgi:hypothetical protein
MAPFPGAKTFPGTRSVFLGSIPPFLGLSKGFPGVFWFLGTIRPFLGTRYPKQKFLATLRSARNVRYEIHFKVETARTSTLADVRRLLMPASFSCYEISHYMLTTFIRFSRKTYRNFNGECHKLHESCGKGGEQKAPSFPHFAKTSRRPMRCHVNLPPMVTASSLPSPPLHSAFPCQHPPTRHPDRGPKRSRPTFCQQHETNLGRAVACLAGWPSVKLVKGDAELLVPPI